MAYLGKTPSQAVRSRYYYTATGGETSLSGSDDNSNVLTFTDGNYVDVSLNGATLVAGSDYNTTTANTIGGLAALTASDIVEVLVYDTFSVFGGNMAANLNFKDNVKANFGTGNDLQIFHDGSNSIIRDAGTGSLKFQYGTSDGVVFDSSGNVGIGTTSPKRNVHLHNTASTTTKIQITNGATGSSTDGDGFQIGIGNDGTASIEQRENVPMTFSTNNTERMRIDSNGNVGIAQSSPAATSSTYKNLQVGLAGVVTGRTDDSPLYLSSNLSYNSGWKYIANTTATQIALGTNIQFFNVPSGTAGTAATLTESMRIDSSGKVGIGVTNPGSFYSGSNSLVAAGGISVYSTNSSRIEFVDGTSGSEAYVGNIVYDHTGNFMRFGVNVSERMRIDSSGNLLVGTTSSINVGSGSDVGVMATNNGGLVAYRSNDIAAFFGRQSTDGDIVQFRKGGTTVGSIGSEGGDALYIGNGDTGIKFSGGGNSIQPFNTSTNSARDAGVDLGTSGARFKDLYLSGGVFLGGVGSANYLDDYEEGGWTPQIWKNATQVTSPTSALGQYRKIGNVIFYSFYFFKSSGSNTDNNEWTLRGMPFSMEAGGNGAYVSLTSDYTGINSVNHFNQAGSHRWQANGNAYFSLYGPQSTTQWTTGYIEFSGSGFVYAL